MKTCKGCGMEIEWIQLKGKDGTAKAHPVDAYPTKRIVMDAGFGRIVDSYTSHFATCSQANDFRRPKADT